MTIKMGVARFNQKHYPRVTAPRIEENGKRMYATLLGNYPSITTVLSCRNTGWVEQWKKNVGEERAAATSKKAAAIGTALHNLTESYLKNDDKGVIRQLLKCMPEAKVRFKNYRKFLNAIEDVFLLEAPVYSNTLKVAGTVDCFASIAGKNYVIDFKTSNKMKQREDIEGYFAQASFYAFAIAEIYNVPVPDIIIAIAVDGMKDPVVYSSKPKLHAAYLVQSITMFNKGESD